MFADLESQALDSDLPALSDLLSIAWARVPPTVPANQLDDAAMSSLRDIVAHDPDDCDAASRVWLHCHGV